MEKKLKQLKETYESQIGTTFTSKDKANVYRKIQSAQDKSRFNLLNKVPKTLTVITYSLMVVLILGIASHQLELIPKVTNGGEGQTPQIKEPPIKKPIDESIKKPTTDDIEEENTQDETSETINTKMQLSSELEEIYKEYEQQKNDTLLEGLTPIDVFKLYFHAINKKDSDTIYALYIKGENFGTPSKKEYFDDLDFYESPYTEDAENDELHQVDEFTIQYPDENRAVVAWESSRGSTRTFQLIHDTDKNVWKVNWLPFQ
ncbi:hypothetical protein [Gracilibacillus sp. YIM 98692]|uniref:hypothetical protein n=1 Tax=Gracilibacillus sp. YIM 98692 TaxID=2663532 RepID=UPI0013D4AE4D|nr:hypothetical protein [Gracilibacillus sp. YIM 98692]